MNKNIATAVLIALYIIGIILLPILYYIASKYSQSIIFFVIVLPVSLFINYIFIINIAAAKIIKKVKQYEAEQKLSFPNKN